MVALSTRRSRATPAGVGLAQTSDYMRAEEEVTARCNVDRKPSAKQGLSNSIRDMPRRRMMLA
eukprot:7117472-Pyramimonas_sp.AAC.1